MALSAGGGDDLSRSTLGQRALRPAVGDVRSGTDIGDGTLGTLDVEAAGTFPDVSLVFVGTVYGPNDTDFTGTMLTPPSNPAVESVADDQFAASNDSMFAEFGTKGQYTSESLGVAVTPWFNSYWGAMFLSNEDGVQNRDMAEKRERRATLHLRLSGADETTGSPYTIDPRPNKDTWQALTSGGVGTGPIWTVKDVSEPIGGVVEIMRMTKTLKNTLRPESRIQ